MRGFSPSVVALGASTLSISLGAIPVFLLGALAVFIRDELDFSEFSLGLLASAYYACSAVMSVPGGRLAERLGGPRATAVAAAISGGAMVSIALLARSWALLLVFMVAAGVGNGLALPSSNLLLARGVPPRRQGIAFGVKQSSGPIATLVAGASVPLLGLTVGWRWAFVLVGLAGLPLVMLAREDQTLVRQRPASPGLVPVAPLIVIAIGAALAVVGGSSLAAFYVESAVANGVTPGVAGALLAVGSVIGISARVGWGWVGGRWQDVHVPLLGTMLVLGAVGYLLLGQVRGPLTLAVITLLTFTTGWGWPALFMFAIVARSPGGPGLATGIAGTGLYSGGIVGPVAFGAILERAGYDVAWAGVAVCVAIGGVLVYHGGRRLERGL